MNRRDLLKYFGVGAAIVPIIGGEPELNAQAKLIEVPKVEPLSLPSPWKTGAKTEPLRYSFAAGLGGDATVRIYMQDKIRKTFYHIDLPNALVNILEELVHSSGSNQITITYMPGSALSMSYAYAALESSEGNTFSAL